MSTNLDPFQYQPNSMHCVHGAIGVLGHCLYCGANMSKRPDAPPTRLAKAKAALEECRARFAEHTGKAQRAYNEETALIAEVHAAEREAAIPPLLLEVARRVHAANRIGHVTSWDVVEMFAVASGIDPATLRAALEAKP